MAIQVQDIVTQCEAALDAEGFDRYDFDRDFAPAINYAKDWVVSAFNKMLSENKLTEENLRELMRTRIWVTSIYSRVAMSETDLDESVWSIVAVYPETEYAGRLSIQPVSTASVYCPLASYIKSYKDAKKATSENVNQNRLNPFARGNEVEVCDELRSYSYVAFIDYTGAYTVTPTWELEIFPSWAQRPVAIVYLAYPPEVEDIADTIPFPQVLTNMLVSKALDYISWKQGDGTNLKGVTDRDVAVLTQLLT